MGECIRLFIFLVLLLSNVVIFQNCGAPRTTPVQSVDGPESRAEIAFPLESASPFGQVYYYLGGEKGLILCFHGTGGSATDWTDDEKLIFLNAMKQSGYSFLCPSSLNRGDGTANNPSKWSNIANPTNPDVLNVESLLNYYKISSSTPLFIVGYSNGGGFATYFSVLTLHREQIKAVQISNSTGITSNISKPVYFFPTLFNYATCDGVYDAERYQQNTTALEQKNPSVPYLMNNLTSVYESNNCHEFLNTAPTTLSFFDRFLPTENRFLRFSMPIANDTKNKNESDGLGIDGNGNLFMAGPFSGSRTFGGETWISRGPQDAYVVKLSPKGNLIGKPLIITSLDMSGVENIYDLDVDEQGNVYINGAFTHDLALGSYQLKRNGTSEHFIAKLDNNLKVLWVKQFGGSGEDGGNEITLADNNTLVLSAMSDSPDYAPRSGTVAQSWPTGSQVSPCNDKDGFMLKISTANGSVQSVLQIGGAGSQQIRALAAHTDGHTIVGLEYYGTASFKNVNIPSAPPPPDYDPKVDYRLQYDGALFYFNPQGNLLWAKSVTSSGYDNFRAVGFDSSGDIYVSGVHSLSTAFKKYDVTTNTLIHESNFSAVSIDGANPYNQFVMKYTKSGGISWYQRLGLSAKMKSQAGGELVVSADDRIYVSGGFRNKLSLLNRTGGVVKEVYNVTAGVDSTVALILSSSGLFQESLYYRGTDSPANDKVGNSASAVIATRLINGHTYLGLGVVLEATGGLNLITNTNSYKYNTSGTTREFSAALYVK